MSKEIKHGGCMLCKDITVPLLYSIRDPKNPMASIAVCPACFAIHNKER